MTKPLTYEQAFAKLEEIVAQLNSGTLTLDEMVTLYARGRELSDYCRELLDAAELKITQLDDYDADDDYQSPPSDLPPKRPDDDPPF